MAGGNENSPDLSLAASKSFGPWAIGLTSELFRTDGYIAVPEDLRGTIDTAVNSESASGDLTVQRKFGDRGAVFARGSLFGESRHNGTPLQTNSTTIRELDLGGNWDGQELGAFQLRAYASRQSLNQSFTSIAADRNSESLTRTAGVPAQQVGFSVQWQRSVGTRQQLVAGLEESNTHGQTDEQGYFGRQSHQHFRGRRARSELGRLLRGHRSHYAEWLLTASGRVDHWQNFDAFAPPNPAKAVGAARLAGSQRDLLQPSPGAAAQAHQQCLADRFRLPRIPRADFERTLSRLSRGQCFYGVQSQPSRGTPDRRGRRRHRHRLGISA